MAFHLCEKVLLPKSMMSVFIRQSSDKSQMRSIVQNTLPVLLKMVIVTEKGKIWKIVALCGNWKDLMTICTTLSFIGPGKKTKSIRLKLRKYRLQIFVKIMLQYYLISCMYHADEIENRYYGDFTVSLQLLYKSKTILK